MEIVAQQMVTDLPSSFESRFSNLSGAGMAKKAASFCYQTSTLCPNDIDVLEVHDCFSCNEVSRSLNNTCNTIGARTAPKSINACQ